MIRRNDILSGQATVNGILGCFPSEKGLILNGKNLLPMGTNNSS